VSKRFQKSFEWVYTDVVDFTKWISDDSGEFRPLFWITGKPGSGKSTLMRFIMQDPRTIELLPKGYGAPMAYFFHMRGKNHAQKSLRGMLQELVYQSLVQFPGLFDLVRPIYRSLLGHRAGAIDWGVDDLIECIVQLGNVPPTEGVRNRFVIFVDALDENEEQDDNGKILSTLLRVASICEQNAEGLPILKVCLASRDWPIFREALGTDPRLPSLEIHKHTTGDIRDYVEGHLSTAFGQSEPGETPGPVQDLSSSVTQKAHGVFIWVRIVVDNLKRNITDGTPLDALKRYVYDLPDEISDLYKHTLDRIRIEYAMESYVCLNILLSCLSPLTLEGLFWATHFCCSKHLLIPFLPEPGEHGPLSEFLLPESLRPDIRNERMLSWLRSRTGGLIDVMETTTNGVHEDLPVQFIHQTAQEFIRKGDIGQLLSAVSLEAELFLQDDLQLPFDRPSAPDTPTGPVQLCEILGGNYFLARAIMRCQIPPPRALDEVAMFLFDYLRGVEAAIDSSHISFVMDSRDQRRALTSLNSLRYFMTRDQNRHFKKMASELRKAIHGTTGPRRRYPLPTAARETDLYLSSTLSGDNSHSALGVPTATKRAPNKWWYFWPGQFLWLLRLMHNLRNSSIVWPFRFGEPWPAFFVAFGPRLSESRLDRSRDISRIASRHGWGTRLRKGCASFLPRLDTGTPSFQPFPRTGRFSPIETLSCALEWIVGCAQPYHHEVDDADRYAMLKALLEALPAEQARLCCLKRLDTPRGIPALPLLFYCARFKDPRWSRLIWRFSGEIPEYREYAVSRWFSNCMVLPSVHRHLGNRGVALLALDNDEWIDSGTQTMAVVVGLMVAAALSASNAPVLGCFPVRYTPYFDTYKVD